MDNADFLRQNLHPELRVYHELIRTDVSVGTVSQQILPGRYKTRDEALAAAAVFASELRDQKADGTHITYNGATVHLLYGCGQGFTEFCVTSLRDPDVARSIQQLMSGWYGGALPKGVL